MICPSFERFETTDRITLHGLLFRPPRSREAAIFLHGNGGGSVFTSARTEPVAKELIRTGIAYFTFDNRGSGLVRMLSRRTGDGRETVPGGMAYERIADCTADIAGAVKHLRSLGFTRFHLIGHSTGANKIVLNHARKKGAPFASYVLFAPGDDVGIYYDVLGRRRFLALLVRARAMVDRGRGAELTASPGSVWQMSWASLLDTIDPDGDYNAFPFLEVLRQTRLSTKPLFRHARTIRSTPVLVLYGSEDEFCFGDVEGCVRVFRDAVDDRENFRWKIVPGADHGFTGCEPALGRAIAKFIASEGSGR